MFAVQKLLVGAAFIVFFLLPSNAAACTSWHEIQISGGYEIILSNNCGQTVNYALCIRRTGQAWLDYPRGAIANASSANIRVWLNPDQGFSYNVNFGYNSAATPTC